MSIGIKMTIQELKKISFEGFVHLKATYWKERQKLEKDLTDVLKFLTNDEAQEVKINEFSELNNENITIQDGPLACYCSHLRAMIYGYTHFSDYTVIVEDDIIIANTEFIETYLKQVPDDWDIICMNSIPKYMRQDEKALYKFETDFHSTHFYIINHKCFPTLFKGLYPITEQVDVLISNMRNVLNIYNISSTVYQRSICTNTQNNLNIIYNSPNYITIRKALMQFRELLKYYVDIILPNNDRNDAIIDQLIFDIVHLFIIDYSDIRQKSNTENYLMDVNPYENDEKYKEMCICLAYVIQCCRKGIKCNLVADGLVNAIFFTLFKFTYHNKYDNRFNGIMKAYSYGTTAHVYYIKEANVIVKKYNDKLRWVYEDHEDPKEIFKKELDMLLRQKQIKLHIYDDEEMELYMDYAGESLYDNFKLPENWEEQVRNIFQTYDELNIDYREFRLKNILVKDNIINFIDYGLSRDGQNNKNCETFIKLLRMLDNRLKKETPLNQHILYLTLLNNIKIHQMEEYLDNVF